jgi:hypothetical protein
MRGRTKQASGPAYSYLSTAILPILPKQAASQRPLTEVLLLAATAGQWLASATAIDVWQMQTGIHHRPGRPGTPPAGGAPCCRAAQHHDTSWINMVKLVARDTATTSARTVSTAGQPPGSPPTITGLHSSPKRGGGGGDASGTSARLVTGRPALPAGGEVAAAVVRA